MRRLLAACAALLASLAPRAAADGQGAPAAAPPKQDAPAAGDAKPANGRVGELIPDHSAKVARGETEATLSTRKQGKPTVYLLVAVGCPATRPYAERLVALERAYAAKGVDFVYVWANAAEATASKRKLHRELRFGAFLDDAGGAFAKKLKATRTGEAIVADKEGKVVYRGGIDDNLNEPAKVRAKCLQAALDELLAGKAVTKTSGPVFGGTLAP